jgi:hypothetical protein
MEPDAPLKRPARIVVLHAASTEHAAVTVVHADRNREVIFAQRRPKQVAHRRVQSEALRNSIELCARHLEGVVARNWGHDVVRGQGFHRVPRIGGVRYRTRKSDRAAAYAARTVDDS